MAEMLPDRFLLLAALSAAGWIAAFCLFLFEYAPMLMRPRVTLGGEALVGQWSAPAPNRC